MIQGERGLDNKPIKKQKMINIHFNHHDSIPFYPQGTDPLIIIITVRKTLIRRIHVDNESSVNIIQTLLEKFSY